MDTVETTAVAVGVHSVNLLSEIETCVCVCKINIFKFHTCVLIVFYLLAQSLLSLSLPPRHDGLIILATNRPYDLDGAMHRRIMVAIEFRQPDHLAKKLLSLTHMCALESLATF